MAGQAQLVKEVIDHIDHYPVKDEQTVRWSKETYYRKLGELAECTVDGFEESDLNNHHRISKETIRYELHDILHEVEERQRTSSDTINLNNEFATLKDNRWNSLLGGNYTTYTITFPIHIRDHGRLTNRFTAAGIELINIPYQTWETEYQQRALNADQRYLDEVINRLPADFRFDGYSFWKVEYNANDAKYAFQNVRKALHLFLAKLTYAIHFEDAMKPTAAGRDKLPRYRWSALREPPLYVVFDKNDYIDFFAPSIQFTKSEATRDFAETVQYLQDLPEFSVTRDDPITVETKIVNALLSYHDGMTESTIQDSFLSFWRGIEILAKYDSPHEDVGPKALFIYKYISDTTYIVPGLEEFVEEMAEKRGEFVHRRVDLEISERERGYAKILLHRLLEFYFTMHRVYTLTDFETVLRYGALEESEKETMKKFLS